MTRHSLLKNQRSRLIPEYGRDRVDSDGKLTLRYQSKLLHLGVGRRHARKRVVKLINAPEVRVLDAGTFELLARFVINPDRNYQRAQAIP